MQPTTTASKPAKVTITLADASGTREILRNGVLVGTAYKCTSSWNGCNSRKNTWWLVTNVFGHSYRETTDTLADVRALFA